MIIEWDDAALVDDVGGWPIIRDIATVIFNPATGLMEMTEPELDPVAFQDAEACHAVEEGR